jgi:hypothetical protein
MAPLRRQIKPTKALNVQIIDFTTINEDTIECELPIDPELLLSPESHTELPESQPPPPSLDVPPSTPSLDDQPDRIEWTAIMIQTLFSELLEQAQDGKRADSGFKKEAWESVLREVQAVYIGPYPIPLQKVKQKDVLRLALKCHFISECPAGKSGSFLIETWFPNWAIKRGK